MSELSGPLAGIRVLSLAEQYPGPYATLILADLGADVILVERAKGGDPTRRFSGHFEGLNRNKRSIVVDLKAAAGREAFIRLAETADVVIEGFRPGVMERIGLGEKFLRQRFPALVYASISSFGQTGPLRSRAGHDIAVQGMAGFVSPGENAAPAPLPLADISSAMFAVIGIVSALFERHSTAHGRYIDIGMLDALVSWQTPSLVSALNDLDPAPYPPGDPGYGVVAVGPDRVQYTLSIAGEDHHWRVLCHAIGLHDLADLSTEAREQDRRAVIAQLTAALAKCDASALEQSLESQGVSLAQVLIGTDVARSEQMVARGMVVEVDGHPGVEVIRQPILFDGKANAVTRRAPGLGQHTREVLDEAGFTREEIEELVASTEPEGVSPYESASLGIH